MNLHKGQRVKTLTKSVGIMPRRGVVTSVDGRTIEVKWDDGHRSILSEGAVVPEAAHRNR